MQHPTTTYSLDSIDLAAEREGRAISRIQQYAGVEAERPEIPSAVPVSAFPVRDGKLDGAQHAGRLALKERRIVYKVKSAADRFEEIFAAIRKSPNGIAPAHALPRMDLTATRQDRKRRAHPRPCVAFDASIALACRQRREAFAA
jgi:hypothetical protein